MSRAQLDELRDVYWQSVRRKIDLAPGQRLVDKNPLNLLALPAIRRLFPNSRILLAIRHPCDVVLSSYMQHFTAPDFILLCRNLPSLAAAYVRAFDFWNREASLLQPAVRDVRYEDFVADFETQVRATADFLGLEWTDAMLEPGEHARSKGFISTPSYSQVVQPVNTRSDRPLEILREALPGGDSPVAAIHRPLGLRRLMPRTADRSKECIFRRTLAAGPHAGTSSTAETSGAFPGAPRS